MMKKTIECRDKMLKVKSWFVANDDTICDIGEDSDDMWFNVPDCFSSNSQ